MKRKHGFISHQIDGIYYVVPVGNEIIENNYLIRCNETAFSIWMWLEKDMTEDDLVHNMQECYGIDQAKALIDVRKILQSLREKSLLEES